ncbi:MFS transporter [Sphingomonas aracearum]|nr:MFS transporter [Sphingomonas aracearum]
MAQSLAVRPPTASGRPRPGWSAVFALTLCVSTLIASEFMPVSILTPIAADLHLSEGAAGQAIAISGLFAVLTSLSLAPLTRGMDRRRLLLGLTLAMLASGLLVAFAPNELTFMAGRALIGVVVGGFWSMSAATVMRLVPEAEVPRALALLNGGNAVATTIAAPLGSFLGQFVGWRGAFFVVVPLAAVTFAWQWLVLPAMPAEREAGGGALGLLRRPGARIGVAAAGLLFAGQFALFTYVRPFLEGVTGLSVPALSVVLLLMGLGGLLGSWAAGRLVARSMAGTLMLAPLGLAAIALALTAAGSQAVASAVLLALWGAIGTGAPVAWWTWVARRFPGDAEAGGGLLVAVIQLAITLGAAGGGLLFDAGGYRATFVASAALLLFAALLAGLDARLAGKPTEGAAR